MRRHQCLLAGLAALATISTLPAVAADYEPPMVVDNAPDYVPVEIGSGWYLRGDVGYMTNVSTGGAFDYRTYDASTGTYGASSFDTGTVNGNVIAGIGAGYHFNDWLRADVTADWFNMRFNGTTSAATPCVDPTIDPTFADTTCRSDDSASLNAFSFMANAYVDLGTFRRFTPYVGGGVGYTYAKWGDLSSNNYCVDGAGTCPTGLATTDTHAGINDWRLTYAAMAGVAFDVTRNMKIDLGYTYRKIAAGDMFGWTADDTTAGATGTQGTTPSITQQIVRVGLRYELW